MFGAARPGEGAQGFENVQNSRLRDEGRKPLRQRLGRNVAKESLEQGIPLHSPAQKNADGMSAQLGAGAERLPGAPKIVGIGDLLMAEPEGGYPMLPAPPVAQGPRPATRHKEREAPPPYVPPVVINEKLLWSIGGQPLKGRGKGVKGDGKRPALKR
eukprot:TRINITY_DN60580_c0_g1_i1.p1 TRINITY_DN60580_c0_g1~~TRINITY_DN60580_c0_g1_i1.p1  ORF type:complete len:157 (-),score=24.55 TRINITY_DN60580_c0_g1_i1:65-535(-)